MYKILIKVGISTSDVDYYTEYTETVDDEKEIFQTEDLQELSEKYVEVLKKYPTSRVKVIQDVDINLVADLDDKLSGSNIVNIIYDSI